MSSLVFLCGAVGLAGWWALLRRTPGGLGGRVFPAEWRAGESVLAALLGVYFLLLIMGGKGEREAITLPDIQGGVVLYGVILGTLLTMLAVRGLSPTKVFGLRPAHPFILVALAIICFAATYPVVIMMEEIVSLTGAAVSDQDAMVQFLRGPLTNTDRAWAALLAVVVAPITEEFIFRGFLYGVLKKYFGPLAAMGTSALLFAAIHQNLPAIPVLATLAIGFTLAYELTGSLWAPIVMHMIFNSISLAVILYFPEWAKDF